jgi:PAS domain S-box-containing protein
MPNRRPSKEQLLEQLKHLVEATAGDRDRQGLLHEVQVYQEELTAQNEALREMQVALEETRDRFVELYDFAPNAYVTLDAHGVILQVNLTGAAWLGKSKQALEGMPLFGFIDGAHRSEWLTFLRRCRDYTRGPSVGVELRLKTPDGPRWVELLCEPRVSVAARRNEWFTALIDINERKRLESEREEASQARLDLAGRLISVQEEERQRIARDLHDNVGQQLTGIRLQLDALNLSTSLDEATRARIEQALIDIQRLDRSLDFIAAELRPYSLDLGFPTAVEQFIRGWSRTFGIEAVFHADAFESAVRLAAETETHLYRIVQEALNNVFKHAHATRVSVLIERRRANLVLVIEDNGQGFDPESQRRSERRGLGLVGMRERAALIGAHLEIESAPGGGTTVFLTVPAVSFG